MNLPVLLTDGEDGWVVAVCPAIPGCVSQGKTREEALENIREAIHLCLETMADEGWILKPPIEIAEIEV